MIHEVLNSGKDAAITGKELAAIFGCNIRDITIQIEKERREGQPICAGSGYNPGYYLAADEEELQDYCKRLHHRAAELYKTRRGLLSATIK